MSAREQNYQPHYRQHHQLSAATFLCGIMVGICLSAAVVFWLFVWSLRP